MRSRRNAIEAIAGPINSSIFIDREMEVFTLGLKAIATELHDANSYSISVIRPLKYSQSQSCYRPLTTAHPDWVTAPLNNADQDSEDCLGITEFV